MILDTCKTKKSKVLFQLIVKVTKKANTIFEKASGLVIELHEKEQSMVLKKTFDWRHLTFLMFEDNVELSLYPIFTKLSKSFSHILGNIG